MLVTMFRRRQRQIHKQLAGVVGDPHAEESAWMTACLAAGEKSLVKADHGSSLRPLLPLTRALAVTSIGLNVLFSWGMIGLLCQQLISGLGGRGDLLVGPSSGIGPGLGILLTLFAVCGFWPRFCSSSKASFTPHTFVFFGALVCTIALLSLHSTTFVAGLVTACFGALAYFPAVKLAAYTRKTLSSSFRFDRTVLLCGLASLPCAALMAYAIFATINSVYTGPSIHPFSLERVGALSAFLTLSALLPAYVCARVSRAQSVPSCLALNAIFNAPLLAGLLLCALFTTLTCIDPANLFNSAALIGGNWGMFLIPLALTGSGSALAARRNAAWAKEQLIKAGYNQAIESEA